MTESTIRYERGDDGIAILIFDDPNQSANTMNAAYAASMAASVARLEVERDELAGVVLTSAKKTFFAGGDLHELRAATRTQAKEFGAGVREMKGQLRRLETLGKPVVAAINGTALGGGLEICLACHHRIAVDDPKLVVGFPEVTLGLLPGGGGIVRSVRLLGITDALTKVLLQGQRLDPATARELGLVDEIVSTVDDLIPTAKRWIEANPEAAQPWDAIGYKIPGGAPSDQVMAQSLPALPANLRKRLRGANYPAPKAIIAAAVEGAQVDVDDALEIETRYFVDLATGQVAKNMIQAFFFDTQRVSGDRGWPVAGEPWQPKKVAVLGAGMMGAAIAYVCAKSGLEVVLKDVSLEAAARGKSYSEKLVAKGNGDPALLDRITPTADASHAAGADVVIEAVFEDPKIKAQVFAEVEPHLAPGALLGSNTSTLPITSLAAASARPAQFIGLHFFSPVDRMPLLEIIRGSETSDETLQRALDLAKRIRKTPIVVNDSRGFFTSRVISAFIDEGIAMLAEGIPAPSIEQASSQAGYPAPVLQLSDELNLRLMHKIREQYQTAAKAEGRVWTAHPVEPVIDRMLDLERPGRLAGAGFYDYADRKRAGLWPGLNEVFPPVDDPSAISLSDLAERMLFAEAIEAVRCLEEGVIESVAEANVGSILGIGFPGWTGGVLQYINGYAGGLAGFVARAHALAAEHGERFDPPPGLVAKAEAGEIYTDTQSLVAA
jgi:3-hydroxyacyl-CoA dehydrogenase / enoyl-CoA hydratase / 3-hydroxybutyryl-CoA epimerase